MTDARCAETRLDEAERLEAARERMQRAWKEACAA